MLKPLKLLLQLKNKSMPTASNRSTRKEHHDASTTDSTRSLIFKLGPSYPRRSNMFARVVKEEKAQTNSSRSLTGVTSFRAGLSNGTPLLADSYFPQRVFGLVASDPQCLIPRYLLSLYTPQQTTVSEGTLIQLIRTFTVALVGKSSETLDIRHRL